MHPEPYFSRRGDELYRTHWTRGVFIVEEWVSGAWHAITESDYILRKADFVLRLTRPISASKATEMIEKSGG